MFWVIVGVVVAVVLLLAWRADRRRVVNAHAAEDSGASQGRLLTEAQRTRNDLGQGGL